MFGKKWYLFIAVLMIASVVLAACGGEDQQKVCAVLDTGGENDRSFNEFTLKGARDAAEEFDLEFAHIV